MAAAVGYVLLVSAAATAPLLLITGFVTATGADSGPIFVLVVLALAALLALCIALPHVVLCRRAGAPSTLKGFWPHRSEQLVLDLTMPQAFGVAWHAVLPQARIRRWDHGTWFEARTGASMATFGENVVVRCVPGGSADHVTVDISVRPVVPTALADYGKSQRVLRSIVTPLREAERWRRENEPPRSGHDQLTHG